MADSQIQNKQQMPPSKSVDFIEGGICMCIGRLGSEASLPCK
ncbi:hypothetical protein B481_0646 [Planococcus halocryophilus Or1]|nr:hypothetical protein B481_0646 [Planococcus halocryophilus Or1]